MNNSDIDNFPIARAYKDYKGGEGFDSNPYLKDSSDYIQYQQEMHRLLGEELKAMNQEICHAN